MSQNKVHLGIIGAGRIGRLHAEHLRYRVPGAEPVAIADIVRSAAETLARELEISVAVADHRALLEEKSIDAVLICSATETHSRLIQEAADAGKHVFCEKPIALELEEIDRALRAVQAAGVKLQIGFNRRFDANFAKIRTEIENGKIGTPHVLRITSRDPEPPPLEYVRSSGGIFLDMAIHDFDMARFLMNSEVEEVYAVGNVLISPEFKNAGDVDTAITTLRFENGALGTIDNSRKAAYGYDQRVEVFGSKGMLTVSNNFPDSHVLMDVTGTSSSKPLYFFLERYQDSFVAELQAFVRAILRDTETPVTGRDGLMPVKIGLAAGKSLAENRPVPIAEIG